MGPAEIEAFLTHLAMAGNGARSTQHQAFNAWLFLSREVLGISLDDAGINAMRARKKGTLPVVLTKDEVQRVILATPGVDQWIAKLLYGSGLRLSEGLRLRVQDVDCSLHEVRVRDGKGDKDRMTLFPEALHTVACCTALCSAAVSRCTPVLVVPFYVPASRPAATPPPRRRVCQRVTSVS
jgi:site-specific recombinase XerD